MSSGKVILRGMKYPCKIGCTEAERAFPQTIEIDLECRVDLKAAAASGAVEDSVCWETADRLLAITVSGQEWTLVEQLAVETLQSVFQTFPAAQHVLIRIKKTPFSHGDWVGVELEQNRADLDR